MDSKTSHLNGRIAEIGDVLIIGEFTKPGSPARDKEPYAAFEAVDAPGGAAAIYHGDTFEIRAPAWPSYDGRIVVADTHAREHAVMRQLMSLDLVFRDTNEVVAIGSMPKARDLQFTLIQRTFF